MIQFLKRLFKVFSCNKRLLLNLFFSIAKQKKSSENKAGLNREQLLQLALAWNAIEVAKEHIIKDDLSDLTVSFYFI
jgi:hypothetical protein